ncbi:hypothetical protein BDZ94DRAFT_43665 [Collybia nuda]|uniref:Uncharacterized protein n=1 Tax=Collybia nuda TaxID=64659 RepID=A0A9P5YJT5_9AGAR|nr:hypothetical protein BDZ94DRAFT_43665 [Collybia nuda]
MISASSISVETQVLTSSNLSQPALALQVIQLVDSYMLWVGVAEGSLDDVQKSTLRGNLCKDWACAMPPITAGTIGPATSLFRSTGSDIALSMAQRLARRFKKQILLSVDIPSTYLAAGQGPGILLEAEKGIVKVLSGIENK